MFLVYVNDLPDAVQCSLRMFADDTKLFARVTTDREVSELQTDIDALAAWSRTWLMPFNDEKCKVLHIGPVTLSARYTIGDTLLSCTEVEKDLGVLIDSELKFKQQAAAAVAKATQLLAVIRHSFALLDERPLPILYKSLVRPHLESCEPCVGSIQPDRPEEAGKGAEKDNLSGDKAPTSAIRNQTEKPAATLVALQAQTR